MGKDLDKDHYGISIDKIVFSDDKKKTEIYSLDMADVLVKALFVFITLSGVLFCLNGVFGLEVDCIGILTGLFAFLIIFSIVFSLKEKAKLFAMLALAFGSVLFILIFFKDLLLDLKVLYNHIVVYYNSYYSKNLPAFNITRPFYSKCDLAVLFILLISGALLSKSAADSENNFLSLFTLLPFIVLFLACGQMPDILPGFTVILGLLLLSFRHSVNFNRKKKAICDDRIIGSRRAYVLFPATFISLLALAAGGFKLYPFVEEIIYPIRMQVYESGLSELLDQIRGGYSNGGINDGELGRGTEIHFNNKTHLIVKSDTQISGYTYLKGHVADIYTGEKWEQLPDEIYDKAFFNDNTDSKYDILNLPFQITDYLYLHSQLNEADQDESYIKPVRLEVSVPNRKINDYQYVCQPYNALLSENDGAVFGINYLKRNDDGSLNNVYDYYSPVSGEYSSSFVKKLRHDLVKAAKNPDISGDKTYQELVSLEKRYSSFVHKNDLQLPAGFEDFKEKYEFLNISIDEAIFYVQHEVSRNAEYSLKPDSIPEGKDFVHFFMNESKKGYCVYFASAAVLIFRALGYPARYVQGYLIPPMEKGQTFEVNDSYAHAWAEVYLDGFGWIPVEVTPGYNGESAGFTPEMNNSGNSNGYNSDLVEKPTAPKETEKTTEESTEESAKEPTEETTEEAAEETTTETAEEKTSSSDTVTSKDDHGQTGSEKTEKDSEGVSENNTEVTTKDMDIGNTSLIDKTHQSPENEDKNTITILPELIKTVKILGAFGAFALSAAGLVYIRRRQVRSSRSRRFKQKSQKNSFLAIYRELCFMSERYYVPINEDTDISLLVDSYNIKEETWTMIFEIAAEAAYSSHDISLENTKLMLSVYHRCRRVICDKTGVLKKILFYVWDAYR